VAAAHNQMSDGEPAARALFESKLNPPPPRPAVVSRTALVDRLVSANNVPITSVVAPPGYGKTTLLSQWAHRDNARVAWLSIDRHDNDLSQFVSYTAAALDRVEPIDPALLGPAARRHSVAGAASGVAAAMAGMKQPVTLVLDHVEALENAECLDTVAELALHLPPGSRLALATRVDPPIPVPRLRAGGDIMEIGVDDLTMNDAEARRLLENAGVELSDDDLDKVIARTEGWPVGLYLAALALRAGGSRQDAGIPFSGDDRIVAEYLRAEVLDQISPEEVRFLTRTSVLDRMSAHLCDAVLESSGSDEILESLAHSNLLLVALDRQGLWYRYHHLFRDLLRAELTRREPEIITALQIRASGWCEDNGLPEMAIEHAEAGSDADRTNRLLLTHGPSLYAAGRAESVHRWMTWFDDHSLVEQYPALAALGAIAFSTSTRIGDVERWAAAAEGSSVAPPGSEGERARRASPERMLPDGSTLAAWLAIMRLALCADGIDGIRRDADIAAEGLSAQSPYRAAAQSFEALGLLAAGEVERADALFAHAYSRAVVASRFPSAVLASAMRGLIAIGANDWAAADERCREALEVLNAFPALDDYAESAPGFLLAARTARHDRDTTAARAYLARAARLRPQLTYGRPVLAVVALVEFARAYAEIGDSAGAREVLRQAREILKQRPNLGTLPAQLDALEARIDAMQSGTVGASSLTAAELRLVPFLPTHLTFAEVAQRLHVARSTAKTQAISIYQKLGVSSRGAAVEQLQALGLLDL
jgi:LuxR family transcriptional regulator, maltose regulon positive regulatory protein